MKKKKIIARAIVAAAVIAFMAAVRPDRPPTVIEATVLTLLLYEGACTGLAIAWAEDDADTAEQEREEAA